MHPEEIIEGDAKHSNGDVNTPPSSAKLDRAEDMGSSSSFGTIPAQSSSRGHERVDSSESASRYLRAVAHGITFTNMRINPD